MRSLATAISPPTRPLRLIPLVRRLLVAVAVALLPASGHAAPGGGTFRGQGLEVRLVPAEAGRFRGEVRVDGAVHPLTGSGNPIRGTFGLGDQLRIYQATIDGDVLRFQVGGRALVLLRVGAVGGGSVPAPGPPGPTPAVIEAHVELTRFTIGLLAGQPDLPLTAGSRRLIVDQLVALYPRLDQAGRMQLEALPERQRQTARLWASLDPPSRRQFIQAFQASWQQRLARATPTLSPAQRASYQRWQSAATAYQGAVRPLGGGARTYHDKAIAVAQARQAQGRRFSATDGAMLMGEKMTAHFVQSNINQMVWNNWHNSRP